MSPNGYTKSIYEHSTDGKTIIGYSEKLNHSLIRDGDIVKPAAGAYVPAPKEWFGKRYNSKKHWPMYSKA